MGLLRWSPPEYTRKLALDTPTPDCYSMGVKANETGGTAMATWIKLDNGEWGVKIEGSEYHASSWPGLPCKVTAKSGKSKTVIIGEHVRSYLAKGGRHVDIFTVAKQAPDNPPELSEDAWGDAIEEEYGVRLSPGFRPYATKVKGVYYVYAGSEYVATLDGTNPDPAEAKDWSDTLGHMPRHGKGIETARRQGQ